MSTKKAKEQHIAVFGESGSGKTVLLSSFYGAMQETQYVQTSLFNVLPDDIGQGNRLLQNYLRMKNSARLPEANRFSATSYSFFIKMKSPTIAKSPKRKQSGHLRLVWHDYPGEWFEQDVSGPEEAQRRVDTFRSLLGSDVALLLVDGQRLVDNSGAEERYLKSLLTNLRNALLSLKDDLLTDGKPLVEFPRVWAIALSKSDLLPNLNVTGFRDLLIERVGDDIEGLRSVLAEFVEASDALSVGEDFVLLSSAEFDVDKIEVTKRVGVELMLPIAAMLTFERHVRWAKTKLLPAKVSESLLQSAAPIAAMLLDTKFKPDSPLGVVVKIASRVLSKEVLDDATKMLEGMLAEAHSEARAKHDNLRATMTGFQLDLNKGEKEQILLKSIR